ncbi:MAG: hypothetical protein ABWY54_00230 [Glaciihabitans sp.]
MNTLSKPAALFAVTIAAALLLSGCTAPAPADESTDAPAAEQPSSGDDASEAAALVEERYELVKAGDYESACALYSEAFAELFIEIADAAGGTCVEAHEKAAQNAADYQATAAEQDRAGLTPFFYVPSEIEVDASAIKVDAPGLAYLAEGTVVSLDPTEFEDGAGLTPGWLRSQDYVKRGDDGTWRFISPLEQ